MCTYIYIYIKIWFRLSWFVECCHDVPLRSEVFRVLNTFVWIFVQISVNGGVAALLSELAVLKKRLRPIGAHPCPSVPIPIDSKIKSDSVSLIENFDGEHQDIQYCNLGLFMSLWRFLRKESQKGVTNNLSVSFLSLFFPLKCLKCLFPGFSDFWFLQELSGFSGLSFDVLHWRVFFRWSVSSPRPPSVVARRRRWRHCSEEAGFPSDVDVLDNLRRPRHRSRCAASRNTKWITTVTQL